MMILRSFSVGSLSTSSSKQSGAAYNQAANGGAAVPDPPQGLNFPNPFTLTREEFKRALLTYARVGTVGPLGTTCLPCTIVECTRSAGKLERLNVHPWTQHIIRVGGAGNVLPIANVFAPRPRSDTLQLALEPCVNDLWNSP